MSFRGRSFAFLHRTQSVHRQARDAGDLTLRSEYSYVLISSQPMLRLRLGGHSSSVDSGTPVSHTVTRYLQGVNMISWAVTFLVIALIAAVLGFSGIAGTAVNIAWILAVVGIILAIVFGVLGRRPPV